MQIILQIQFVKNIMFSGNLHTGVKNQHLAHGKISGSLRLNNETGTSLILMTFKILFIMTSIDKYKLHLI